MFNTTQRFTLVIPILLIGWLIGDSWFISLSEGYVINWRHYLALLLFPVLIYSYLKNPRWTIKATGIYLLIGLFN